MQHVLRSREASEQQASSHTPTKNRMTAGMLFNLLEQKKSVSSRSEISELARQYDIEVDVLERVAAFATSPSTVEGSMRKVVEEDGRERFTTLVRTTLVSRFECLIFIMESSLGPLGRWKFC